MTDMCEFELLACARGSDPEFIISCTNGSSAAYFRIPRRHASHSRVQVMLLWLHHHANYLCSRCSFALSSPQKAFRVAGDVAALFATPI